MLKFNKIVVLSATLVASFFCTYKYRAFAGPRENLLAYMTNSFIREDMAHYSGDPCKFEEEVKAFCSRVLHSLYTSLKGHVVDESLYGNRIFPNRFRIRSV